MAHRLDRQISPLLRPRRPEDVSAVGAVTRGGALTVGGRTPTEPAHEADDRLTRGLPGHLPATRFDRGSGAAAVRPAPRLGGQPESRAPEPDGDLFADLHRAVEALQAQGESRFGFLGRTMPPESGEESLPPTVRMPVRPTGASAEAEETAAKQAARDQAAASRGRARLATA